MYMYVYIERERERERERKREREVYSKLVHSGGSQLAGERLELTLRPVHVKAQLREGSGLRVEGLGFRV